MVTKRAERLIFLALGVVLGLYGGVGFDVLGWVLALGATAQLSNLYPREDTNG